MIQIIDNSTILEAGEFLIGIKKFSPDNIEAVERRVENLLILLHALLIGDKIKHSALKIDKNNKGVQYLTEQTLTKYIIEPLDWNWNKENELLSFVRQKIKNEIDTGILQPVIIDLANKVNLSMLVADEIRTYLLPEGLNHYWKNIGFENGDSNEAIELYQSFKDLFSFTLESKNQELSIHQEIVNFIKSTVKNIDQSNRIIEWYWLSFLSNVIRAEYYINLARINKSLYSPLATRRIIIEALIQDDPKDEVYIIQNDERTESLFLAFQYILSQSNYRRERFIETLLTLKNQENNIINQISKLLIKINSNGVIKQEIRDEFINIEQQINKNLNSESLSSDRIYNRLNNQFKQNWLYK